MFRLRLMAFAAALLFSSAVHAETRVFIIANHADTYGVDRCLVSNERCGAVVATAYCQAQQFAEAKSYRKLGHDEITWSAQTMTDSTCRGGVCPALVAIECER